MHLKVAAILQALLDRQADGGERDNREAHVGEGGSSKPSRRERWMNDPTHCLLEGVTRRCHTCRGWWVVLVGILGGSSDKPERGVASQGFEPRTNGL